jgi:hypothetical protein
MSYNLLFQIIPNISSNAYALAINKNSPAPGNQLIINNFDSSDTDQLWTFVYVQQPGALILFNPARNYYAAPTGLDKGAAVVLNQMPSGSGFNFTGNNTWNISGTAIRPQGNWDLNLNVLGNNWRPGTSVGIYTWDGGQPNEVWTINPVAG